MYTARGERCAIECAAEMIRDYCGKRFVAVCNSVGEDGRYCLLRDDVIAIWGIRLFFLYTSVLTVRRIVGTFFPRPFLLSSL